jgi:two-component system, chemotaxis family, sensor kinase CheA
MDDLTGDFVADTRESYEAVTPYLAVWVRDPANRAALDALFRFAHTVKGNAGFLNMGRFERLCDGIEQALVAIRDEGCVPDPSIVAGVAALIHRVGAVAEAIEAGVGLPAADEPGMIAALGFVPLETSPFPKVGTLATATQSRTIRMPAEQFDHLANCVEGVASAHRHILDLMTAAPSAAALGPSLADLSTQISQMTQALTLSRLQPVERLFKGLDRIVSQTAIALGKQARVSFSGGDLMIDREVVDRLRDPLLHLIRNALDHGLEDPTARRAAGKKSEGLICLVAALSPDGFTLTVSDDGRGIDKDALVQSAAGKGVLLACSVDALDDAQLTALLTAPGVTTANASTALSGRGVGMDAVQTAMNRLGGRLLLSNNPGKGLTFTLSLPLRARTSDAA